VNWAVLGGLTRDGRDDRCFALRSAQQAGPGSGPRRIEMHCIGG
jgi:hypothetical protein